MGIEIGAAAAALKVSETERPPAGVRAADDDLERELAGLQDRLVLLEERLSLVLKEAPDGAATLVRAPEASPLAEWLRARNDTAQRCRSIVDDIIVRLDI